MVMARFLPEFSAKAQIWMNRIGNAVLTFGILAMLWFMREALKGLLTWWLPLGALLLALGSIAAIRVLVPTVDLLSRRTLEICNANRHIGLALLLSGHYLQAKGALPAVAAYALIAPFVMGGMSWWFNRRSPHQRLSERLVLARTSHGTIKLCSRARFVWSTKRMGSARRVR